MNNKTLTLGIVTCITGSVMADYTGFSFEDVDANPGTFRVYLDFDNETDELYAIFGDSQSTLFTESNNGFYQNAFGGPTSADINPALYDPFPSLMYDSWVTIGLEDNVDNNMLNIGIDWSDFEDNGGRFETANGTWFATPDDSQVIVGEDLRLLIAQFTMLQPELGDVVGNFNIQGKSGTTGDSFQVRDIAWSYPVPGPGVLSMLGIAGIMFVRRRR